MPPCSGAGYITTAISSAAYPALTGWLYQDATSLSFVGAIGATSLKVGDSTILPLINQTRYYGFFAVPFLNPQNLQAEGESGTLSAGWTSVVDANASGGNTARAASGTAINAQDKFGTPWVPPPGSYNIFVRVRVTSVAGATPEMTLGVLDTVTSTFVAGGAATFAANQVSTSYVWLQVTGGSSMQLPAGHSLVFLANVSSTLGTDWFIDEAVLVPDNLGSPLICGPNDIFKEFAFDRQTRVIPI
jgi:hypothetical protein